MPTYNEQLKKLTPTLLDQNILKKSEQLLPFALSDVFTANIGISLSPMLHFWQLDQTIILGMKDSRVPHLSKGLYTLFDQEYDVLLRNSGGLGIVADKGVLNISFILPNTSDMSLDVSSAYQLITQIISKSFQDFSVSIEAKEISDSYCPGTYDLSIDGKKFAGIAQRRLKEGISVMIYLSVSGDQIHRGELMRNFYIQGLGEAFGTDGYPPVRPKAMANLDTLLQTKLTIADVKKRILHAYQSFFMNELTKTTYTESVSLMDQLEKPLERMKERNDMIKDIKEGYDEYRL